jgi:membrane protease YdiL (CAAX protease family)
VTSIHWSGVLLTFGTLLALSCMEELGFRGYPLRALVPTLGPWGAQALVAVAFALSHFLYGWSWASVVFGVLPSAFLFGAAALASGGLAMPIGLHMALNVAQWSIGEKESTGFFTQTVDQTARARIEQVAPITGMAVILAMAAVLWWWHGIGRVARLPRRRC